VKDRCGRWSDEPRAEGNCVSVSERGEEAGEQTLDLMNKNHIEGMKRGVSQPKMVTPEKDQSGLM
jgi:hypothetical protein